MDKFLQVVAEVNSYINNIVWGWPMIILILGAGIVITIRTKAMQVRKFKDSLNETIVPTLKSIGKKQPSKTRKENSISQFPSSLVA